jgi:hypothetical protein
MALPNKKARATGLKKGDRVQTNGAFVALFSKGATKQWRGVLLRPHALIQVSWHVRVDSVGPEQVLHHRYLEKEQGK